MPDDVMPGFVRVDHAWTAEERRNAALCRLGRFGARSRIPPGLYALGRPGAESPVVATANYRLTFDILRRDLAGTDCWILVLDTRGLDVGSAAAAGLFGTDELVTRLAASRLPRLVGHRTLLIPARAAASVDPSLVARSTGFDVRVGPARASDLPGFLSTGTVSGARGISLGEAASLVPVELGRSLMRFPGFAFAVLLIAGLGPEGVSLQRAFAGSWPLLLLGLASILCGSLLAPLLCARVRFPPLWAWGGMLGAGASASLLEAARFARGMDPYLLAASWLFFPFASAFMAGQFERAVPLGALGGRTGQLPRVLALVVAAATLALLALSVVRRLTGGGG